MGFFRYDGFLMTLMVKIANMIIVTFFWLVTCIPVVTIIPATAAMFHTSLRVIRKSGTGVARDYFRHFKESLKQGIPLSIICLVVGLLLYTALDFGRQLWQSSGLWAAYYALGFLLAFLFATMVLFIPPVLSRFECSVASIIRLSLYLASRNLLRSAGYVALLVLVAFLVNFYPIALLILPGVYADLVCGSMDKALNRYMRDNGILEDEEEEAQAETQAPAEAEPAEEAASSLELAKMLDEADDAPGQVGSHE